MPSFIICSYSIKNARNSPMTDIITNADTYDKCNEAMISLRQWAEWLCSDNVQKMQRPHECSFTHERVPQMLQNAGNSHAQAWAVLHWAKQGFPLEQLSTPTKERDRWCVAAGTRETKDKVSDAAKVSQENKGEWGRTRERERDRKHMYRAWYLVIHC